MIRLLYLSTDPGVPVLGHKGASVHVREMAAALARAGAEVTIASPRVADEGARIEAGLSLVEIPPVVAAAHPTAESLAAATTSQQARVLALCRSLRIEAIYERYALFGSAGVAAAQIAGVPHVLEVNAPLRAEARRYRTLPQARLAACAEAVVYAATDHIYCVSEPLAATVRRAGPGTPVGVLPNGVCPARFPEPRARRGGGAFVIGFAGSLKPWHGIDTLLAACSMAFAVEPCLRLELVGDGPLRSALHASGLGEARMRWHGPVAHERAVELIRSWNVGVAPYRNGNGFYFSPLKVLEYMAAGICPVASDLGQIRTLLGSGTRGVLLRPDDPAALADALLGLAQRPKRAADLGLRARAYVLAHHTWEGNARTVLARLRELGRRAAA